MKLLFFISTYLLFFNLTSYSQWVRQTNGLQSYTAVGQAIDACDNNTALISFDNILYKTYDGGENWQKTSSTSSRGGIVDLSIIDKLHLWICTDAGEIMASTDGGADWSVQFYDTTLTIFINYIKMFDLNNGIAMGDTKTVINHVSAPGPAIFLKTTNGGNNWISVNDSAFGGGSTSEWLMLDFLNVNTGYFFEWGVNPRKLYKTTDGCKTWFATNFPYTNADLIKFYNVNIGLVSNKLESDFKWNINRTIDGGANWETFSLEANSWPYDIEFLPNDPSKAWYVDQTNLYYSRDTGRTWVEQKIYSGNLNGRDLVFTDSTHGWLICDSGKVFHTINNGSNLTAISNSENTLPANNLLAQNYPNPFNPSTIINWQLKKSSFVTLKIYNILGKEITTLVSEFQKAGKHSVTFNTQKLSEGNFSSGIYFYRIQTGDFTETKKFVLLK